MIELLLFQTGGVDIARGAFAPFVDGDLDRAFPSHDQRSWERWRHAPEVYR